MPPPPEQTLDLTAGTQIDLARARYDAAWHEALVSGRPGPEREPFLSSVGPDRAHLATLLDTIDGAYHRLRELLRSGAATLSPLGPAPKPQPDQSKDEAPLFAETIQSSTPCGELQIPGVGSQFAETVESGAGTARSADQSPPPLAEGVAVGGYELLGVIAHGGMGVVYKARHKRLDRLAAIKMVLAGAHASADQFARFQGESQVVARLQHP